jgi:hypothetical protein
VNLFYPRHFSQTSPPLFSLPSTAQDRLTIANADSQATKGDEAWTEDEEKELLRIVNDAEYRKVCCHGGGRFIY